MGKKRGGTAEDSETLQDGRPKRREEDGGGKTAKIKTWLILHFGMMLYSLANVCTKMAGMERFLSLQFVFWCCGMVALTGMYALFWQQALKRLPLMTAYSNKAVVILWGFFWGRLFFQEKISWGKLAGAVVVMAGVWLMAKEQEGD